MASRSGVLVACAGSARQPKGASSQALRPGSSGGDRSGMGAFCRHRDHPVQPHETFGFTNAEHAGGTDLAVVVKHESGVVRERGVLVL